MFASLIYCVKKSDNIDNLKNVLFGRRGKSTMCFGQSEKSI